MPPSLGLAPQKSRLGVLLDHFAAIDDLRDVRRIAHPLAEILLLVVCATMADCDDYDHIAAWGEAHLDRAVQRCWMGCTEAALLHTRGEVGV